MTPLNHSRRASLVARRTTVLITIVVITSALGLTGCSIIKATHNLLHGTAAIKSLTGKVNTGDMTHYEVTYVTTGSPATTIEYADAPPHDFAFDTTVAGQGVRFIQSSAGAFACTKSSSSGSGSGTGWSCLKLKGEESVLLVEESEDGVLPAEVAKALKSEAKDLRGQVKELARELSKSLHEQGPHLIQMVI